MSDPVKALEAPPAGPRLALERAPHFFRPGRHGAKDGPAGATLKLIEDETRLNIEARRGRTADLLAALGQTFGAAPVDAPRTVEVGGFEFFGVGPSRWHAVRRGVDAAAKAVALAATARSGATVVEVSHGFMAFRLEGPCAREALQKLVQIDLDESAFAPGACALTELHGMHAQIRRTLDGAAFECAVARSFAGSFYGALVHAAQAYGIEVAPVAGA